MLTPSLPESTDGLSRAETANRAIRADLDRRFPNVVIRSFPAATSAAADSWPQPEPEPPGLPPVLSLRADMLAEPLAAFVADLAARTSSPPEFGAAAAIVVLAAACGRRARIQPKRRDSTWRVVPNLWGGICAPPASLKSPILREATAPLVGLDANAARENAEAFKHFFEETERYAVARAVWRDQRKAALKRGQAPPAAPPDDAPQQPPAVRFIVNDPTPEALHVALAANPGGLLLFRDELMGWLAGLDRQGREGERAFALESWSGDGCHTIDRIGRGSVRAEHVCVSILGSIQPARLRGYLDDALRDGPRNDGLMQRFQVLVFPDPPRRYTYRDDPGDAAARLAWQKTVHRIAALPLDPERVMLFDDQAQTDFAAWFEALERRLRSGGLPDVMAAHLGKYRSLMPSLALLDHLTTWAASDDPANEPTPRVGRESLARAVALCGWLESHAWRIYQSRATAEARAARELMRRIQAGDIGANAEFTVRDLQRKHFADLDNSDVCRAACAELVSAGWLRLSETDPTPRGGRPSQTFVINPLVPRSAQ